jgi:hypothetical protein
MGQQKTPQRDLQSGAIHPLLLTAFTIFGNLQGDPSLLDTGPTELFKF